MAKPQIWVIILKQPLLRNLSYDCVHVRAHVFAGDHTGRKTVCCIVATVSSLALPLTKPSEGLLHAKVFWLLYNVKSLEVVPKTNSKSNDLIVLHNSLASLYFGKAWRDSFTMTRKGGQFGYDAIDAWLCFAIYFCLFSKNWPTFTVCLGKVGKEKKNLCFCHILL